MTIVKTGLEVLVARNFSPIRHKRVGLVTHAAAVDSQLRSATDLFAQGPIHLTTIFGPEHGLHSQAQDLIGVSAEESRSTVRVVSLYGKDAASLKPTMEQLRELDVLVIDMQDIGTRFYTFQATMLFCLQVALPIGLPVFVLDRPNPIGGLDIEGPSLQKGFESFVGAYDIAVRHGMTMGELARMYCSELQLGPGLLEVIPCEGWKRHDSIESTGLPWVLPSPNMPTIETALVYPGQCLLEGTNLSEGRGTTKPFEICGAPWIEAESLAKRMNSMKLPGVIFRPVWFRPTFQKHYGIDCGGVQLHVRDRTAFQPVRTSLALLRAMWELSGSRFAWRTEVYEFIERPIAIDLLFGSDRERLAIESGHSDDPILRAWEREEEIFRERRRRYLLY